MSIENGLRHATALRIGLGRVRGGAAAGEDLK